MREAGPACSFWRDSGPRQNRVGHGSSPVKNRLVQPRPAPLLCFSISGLGGRGETPSPRSLGQGLLPVTMPDPQPLPEVLQGCVPLMAPPGLSLHSGKGQGPLLPGPDSSKKRGLPLLSSSKRTGRNKGSRCRGVRVTSERQQRGRKALRAGPRALSAPGSPSRRGRPRRPAGKAPRRPP